MAVLALRDHDAMQTIRVQRGGNASPARRRVAAAPTAAPVCRRCDHAVARHRVAVDDEQLAAALAAHQLQVLVIENDLATAQSRSLRVSTAGGRSGFLAQQRSTQWRKDAFRCSGCVKM